MEGGSCSGGSRPQQRRRRCINLASMNRRLDAWLYVNSAGLVECGHICIMGVHASDKGGKEGAQVVSHGS